MKDPPTLADACIASMFDKSWYGDISNKRHQLVRQVLRSVVDARKFVLDGAMSRYLAELSDSFWHGGMRKRVRMLDNARQFARLPHALTWIEFSYDAHYLARIMELKSQGVGSLSGKNPQRMGWLLRQHPHNDAAFMSIEFRSGAKAPKRVFFHPLACAWITNDTPSPWRQFPTPGLPTSEAVVGMGGYCSTQAHWHGFLGDELTANMIDAMARGFEHSEADMSVAAKPIIGLRALWALLATINDLPVAMEFVEPSHGYVARGRYRKFLKHSIVHLTVPETRWRKLVIKTGVLLRRRAHQVRGHWRKDWRKPLTARCEHVFGEDMICAKCGGHKIWIAEHQRGDASMGFVTHDYAVHHEQQRE